MRKIGIILSVLVLAAMILVACGGEETNTSIPTQNVPPTTVEVTAEVTATSEVGTGTATEVPTEGITTGTPGTPGIPVTGAANSDRLSNELKFTVLDQSGKQVGKVDDMVLDLSKAKILYVVVSAEKKIAVPWASLKLGTDTTSGNTSGQQNAFILQTDTDTFKNAPEFDLKNMPQLGESPDSWDISFRKYWSQGGGAASGNNTPSPAGTAVTDMTATATSTSNTTGTGTGNATSTPATSAGTSQGSGTGQGATSIQGVQLASKVLKAKVMVGTQSPGLGTSTPGAGGLTTSTPSSSGGTGLATSTSTSLATSTPSTSGSTVTTTPTTSSSSTGLATSMPSTGTSTKNLSATIDDMIVNTDLGELMYIVIKTSFDDGVHLIPVPLSLLKFDSENQAFGLDIDVAMLQNAPFFQNDQFPDMTTPGWNSEFDSFWQNNGSGGTGSQATPTP
jgi:sporulation protein YlmC with PRC-barrel domain